MNILHRHHLLYSFIFALLLVLPLDHVQAADLQTQWASSCPAGWVSTGITDDNFDSYHHLGEGFVQGATVVLCIKSDDASITLFSEWNPAGTCSTGYYFMNLYDDLGSASLPGDLPSLHDTNENSYVPSNSSDNHWCLKATGPSSTRVDPLWRVWNGSNTDGPGCQAGETVIMDGINSIFNLNHGVHTGANESSLCLKIVTEGACGSANGVEVSSAPSSNLCLVGTASAVSGPGPWSWTCAGTNGGDTASCSAPKAPTTAPAPTISGTATYTNTSYPFTITGTDPNGLDVSYNIDWNGDGITDETTGPVPSGSSATVYHQWATAGTKTFFAQTDLSGAPNSPWATYSVTLTALPAAPIALLSNNGPIVSGNSVTLTYSCDNTTSASINNGVGTVSPASGGTVTASPVTTTTYTLTCTGAGGSDTDNTTVTVSSGPDLTVTAAPAGATNVSTPAPQTYTGTVQNIGNVLATNYPNILEILDSTGTTVLEEYAATPATVTTPASDVTSISATVPASGVPFNTPGVYLVRFCANMDTSQNFIISESNHSNNCGPSITVSVGVSVSCTVSDQNPASPGSTVTYTAIPANGADSPYTWDDSLGGSYGLKNTATRVIPTWGKWAMSVKASNTSFVTCPLVTVGDSTCSNPPPPTATISGTPPRIRSGNTTTLSWSVQRPVGASCTITGPGVNTAIPVINTCTGPISPATGNTVTPVITTQAIYKVVCDGTEIARTIVNVLPNFVEF